MVFSSIFFYFVSFHFAQSTRVSIAGLSRLIGIYHLLLLCSVYIFSIFQPSHLD
jgi:hypothetical protein